MITQGFLDDVRYINSTLALIDTCTVYKSIFTSSSRSSSTVQTYKIIPNVRFRLDDNEAGPFPQKSIEKIDMNKIWRTGFVPLGTDINVKDEIVHNESGKRYQVMNITIETEAVDIPLILEEK